MAKARPTPAAKFGPSPEEFQEVPAPSEYPTLPDIPQLVENIERSVKTAAETELKIRRVDLGIMELEAKLADGKNIYDKAVQAGAVDEPEAIADFTSSVASAIRQFRILRERIILGDKESATGIDLEQPIRRATSAESVAEQKAAPPPPTEPSIPPEEQNLTMEEAADFLGISYWTFVRHYKDWGILHTTEGGLRFNKATLMKWRQSREK